MKLIPIVHNSEKLLYQIATDEQSELFDRIQNMYNRIGYQEPWTGYFAISVKEIVGSCGFKNQPLDNKVEIAYNTFKPFEGKGFGTEMCRQLIKLAQAFDQKVQIIAETKSTNLPSHRVLIKNGFKCTHTYLDTNAVEIWCWIQSEP